MMHCFVRNVCTAFEYMVLNLFDNSNFMLFELYECAST